MVFETEMEVRSIDRILQLTTNENELFDYSTQGTSLKTLVQYEKRLHVLKGEMGDSTTNNNN